jgi:predicted Zn-dependent peptidase
MKLTRFTLLAIAFLACLSTTFAQKSYEWKTATSGGYAYKYVSNDPMKARFYTLANGLTVILSENHKEPRIAALIPTRAGSNTDPRTNTGLAHYLEHMLFKGTDKYGSMDWAKEKPLLDQIDALYEKYNKTTDSVQRKAIYKEIDAKSGEAAKFAIANEYDKMMASMGGQGTNAFTSFEQTCYTEDIPANAIDRFLKLQAERFRSPVLRIFHTELEAVYEEKNRGLDNDGRKVYETRNAALFPTHNYGQQTTIGTIEHLRNPSLVEIRNYFNKYYVPNNMAIIMAGDFNSDELIKKIEASFKYMVTKPVPEYKPAPELPLTGVISREVFGPTPDNITLAWRWLGSVNAREKIVGTIVDELMSNSKAGLIDLNLVKAQKVLRAGSNPEWNKDYTIWTMTGTPKKDQSLDDVKALLMGELDKLKKGDFDESIIKAIASNSKLSAIQGLENNTSRAYGLLGSFISSKATNWNDEAAINDALGNVTKQEVMDFAKKYCGEGYVVVYKKKGTDPSILKVDKPAITPVEVNREAQSEFLKAVNTTPMATIEPKWLDFSKDMKKGKIGNLDALYVQNTDNDLFRMAYRFDMGSWNSKILPIALQYLQFVGTDKMNAEQISTEFYRLASSFNQSYTDHHITLGMSGLNENFAKTVTLFEDLLTKCKKDDAALELLKGRILKQRNDAKLNKGAILQGLSTYAAFGAKNPRNALQFSDAELKALTADELISFLQNLVSYKHSVVYYGPASMENLATTVSGIHKTPATFKADLPLVADFKAITPEKSMVLFTDYDMVQAEVNWIRPTIKFSPTETPIVELYNNYFGGGMSSIVFQTIRESKALAYSTYAYYQTPNNKNEEYRMLAYVGTQADKIHEAIAGMNELLNTFPASEKSLETAKAGMKKNYQTERITQDNIVYFYLGNQDKGVSEDERKAIYQALDKLTLDDLKKFQETQLANKPYNLCVVASEKKVNLEDLKKYGEVKKLSLEEVFGY